MKDVKDFLKRLYDATEPWARAVLVIFLIGLGTLIWSSRDGGDKPVDITEGQCAECAAVCAVNPEECQDCWRDHHCGPYADAAPCLGVCDKCKHVCHECHHSPHLIARGFYCQECAACETGCSGVDATGPVDGPVGLGGGSSQGCQDLAFVGSYLLEPDRFSDPSDAPYVEKLLAAAAQELGCNIGGNSE